MIPIGQFSKSTQLTVKTIRYYHELGILMPVKIDDDSGCRYYDREALERAGKIKLLKNHGFTLNEIKQIFNECQNDEDLSSFIRTKIENIEKKIEEFNAMEDQLNTLSENTSEKKVDSLAIEEKDIPDRTIASIRFTGRYRDMSENYSILYKKVGKYIKGKPLGLYYDGEYKEEDADIEAAVVLKNAIEPIEGITIRTLKGGKIVSAIHNGPYGEQGPVYLKLFAYCKEKGYTIIYPNEELYLKGPGLIFPRIPKNYITEIRMWIE